MLFSIIIPTYNYAAWLPKALDSVLLQEGDDWELIIVDDGSTDNTADAVARYVEKNPGRIHYFRQDNKGPSAARNFGSRQAGGKYLLFFDADDELLPGALDKFRGMIVKKPEAQLLFGGHMSIDRKGRQRTSPAKTVSASRGDNFIRFLRGGFGSISHGSVLMHREAFGRFGYPETIRNNEDLVLLSRIFALYDCASFPDPVVRINKHSDSLRHNIERIKESGTRPVDLIFDPAVLPADLQQYRREVLSLRSLALFRSLFLAGEYAEAIKTYHQAIRAFPKHLFNLSFLRKYLRAVLFFAGRRLMGKR